MENHKFWNTQPIDISKNSLENKVIEELNIDNVQKEPYKLLEGFEWTELDINNDLELTSIYNFLISYYVDEPNAIKRYHYSKEFLSWFLKPFGYCKELLIGVKYKGKLLATIFGIPINLKIYDKIVKSVEINFLCVHHSLRNKRLAPVLIKEITRRANLLGIYTAIYTTEIDLPNSIMRGTYYHRPLNIPKLIDLNFIKKPDNISLNGFSKLFKTIDTLQLNLRKIKETDFEQCCKLLNEYHMKFKISVQFEQEEFNTHFKFRENIIESYVIEKDGKITDFVSYFFIPSKITEGKHTEMKRAYIYYYFNTENELSKIIENTLLIMKEKQIDVVNCINQYNNNTFIDKLKFKEGTGGLNFYLFNWMCPPIINSDMAMIMV